MTLENCPLCGHEVDFVEGGRVHGHGDYAPEIVCRNFEQCGLRFSPYYYGNEKKLCEFWNEIIKLTCRH